MGLRTSKPLLAVLLCIATAAPVAEAGQPRRGRGPEAWRPKSANNDYDRGYRDGVRRGEEEAQRGRPFGSRALIEGNDYNLGFADGYRAGYNRQFARTPRADRDVRVLQQQRATPRGYREPAFAAGFDNGYERGVSDGRDGDRYDPVRHRDYRDAERGYRDAYGSRDAYRTNFRAGFRQGYEEGYRAGTRNRR
jgi:hypothetical protein